MDETCGHEHPSQPGVHCDKAQHPFGAHMHRGTGTVWAGVAAPVRTRGAKGGRVRQIVDAIESSGLAESTGPPRLPSQGPPPQAARSWQEQQRAWIAAARAALRKVCETNETFTNELVWARVDDIRERRAMVLVTRYGLRAGWMHEDHAVRVKGTWATRDGHEFPLNKLVPVYRSDLFRAE